MTHIYCINAIFICYIWKSPVFAEDFSFFSIKFIIQTLYSNARINNIISSHLKTKQNLKSTL